VYGRDGYSLLQDSDYLNPRMPQRCVELVLTDLSSSFSCRRRACSLKVRRGRAVRNDSDSSWTCLAVVRRFILSNRLQVNGVARITARKLMRLFNLKGGGVKSCIKAKITLT
jgi:hypothetical protein